MKFKIFLSIVLLLISLASSCEPDTQVMIEGYNPPKFRISGRGTLDIIEVSGTDKDPQDTSARWKHYWGIMPKGDIDVSRLEELEPITYGQVPEGFVQVYPEHGEAPPLFEGGKFSFHLGVRDAHGVNMFFTLYRGKIIAENEDR